MKTYAYICVSHRTDDGRYTSFLRSATGNQAPLSPMFASLAELFPWMKCNGWQIDEYMGNQFIPWRVSKEVFRGK